MASASVSYQATIYATLSFSGTLADHRLLIGQKLTATVSGFAGGTTYSWTLSGGNYFAGYSPTDSSASVTSWSSTNSNATTCYFASASSDTVSVAVVSSVGNFTLSGSVTSVAPDYPHSVSAPGTTLLTPGGDHIMYDKASDGSAGILWSGSVTTPSDFVVSGNYGGWNFTQTVDLGRSRIYGGSNQTLNYMGQTSGFLDFGFPYEPSSDPDKYTWDADGATHPSTGETCFDSPDEPLDAGASSYTISETLRMYMMYKPPGSDSVYVPLYKWTWMWSGTATKSGSTWSVTAGSYQGVQSEGATSTHPTWAHKGQQATTWS